MLQKPTNTLESDRLTIWTMGYSNRSQKGFLEMLKGHRIEALVDVRRFPTSKVEHFKKKALTQWLTEQGIEYVWLGEQLGSHICLVAAVAVAAKLFRDGIERLSAIARQKRTCIMCLEPKPKYCHRRFISAYLESEDTRIVHIATKG